jgi:hypothetical protein
LNSKLYDNILLKMRIGKDIIPNEKSFSNSTTEISQTENADADANAERLQFREMFKMKYKYNLDDVIGISEMNLKETEDFVMKNRIPDVGFLIDDKNEFNRINKLHERYEMLISDLKIVEYRTDPSLKANILFGFITLYSGIFLFIFTLTAYLFILQQFTEKEEIKTNLKKAIDF